MGNDRVESVERALTILDCFTEEGQEITLGELAEKSGFYRSTILRLSHSLERYGYLFRHPNGSYRLGPTLRRLGALYGPSPDLKDFVVPILQQLRDQTEESASFYVREGNARICLLRVNSQKSVHHHVTEGTRLPLHLGAPGRILLAFSGEPGEPYDEIREVGYFVAMGEREAEVAGIAAPVISANGVLIGSLNISGPLSRFGPKAQCRFIELVKKAAADLSGTPGLPEAMFGRQKNAGQKKR